MNIKIIPGEINGSFYYFHGGESLRDSEVQRGKNPTNINGQLWYLCYAHKVLLLANTSYKQVCEDAGSFCLND